MKPNFDSTIEKIKTLLDLDTTEATLHRTAKNAFNDQVVPKLDNNDRNIFSTFERRMKEESENKKAILKEALALLEEMSIDKVEPIVEIEEEIFEFKPMIKDSFFDFETIKVHNLFDDSIMYRVIPSF